MFKGISKLFSKKVIKSDDKSVLDIVSDDQAIIDGCRLALHDICIRYDCPGMDTMVHEYDCPGMDVMVHEYDCPGASFAVN